MNAKQKELKAREKQLAGLLGRGVKSWGAAMGKAGLEGEIAGLKRELKAEKETAGLLNVHNNSINAIHPERHDWHEETDYLLGLAEDLARTEMAEDQWTALDLMGDIEKTMKILKLMLKAQHSK